MSLWARFTARWQARKAERKAIAARKEQDRAEAEANLRRALAHVAKDSTFVARDGGMLQNKHMVMSHMVYHGSSGIDCNPGATGNCTGM
jgi:hypothetical protein